MKCKQFESMKYENVVGERNYFGEELRPVSVQALSTHQMKLRQISKVVGKYMLAKLHSTINTTQLRHVRSLVYDYGK